MIYFKDVVLTKCKRNNFPQKNSFSFLQYKALHFNMKDEMGLASVCRSFASTEQSVKEVKIL